MQSAAHLLKTRRFLPLFVTQFFGAFNDNLFKNAAIVLAAYGLFSQQSMKPETVAALAGGLFMLPFLLFSATAGQLADRYEKARLIRYTKLAEMGCAALAGAGLVASSLTLTLAALFLIGTQAAFFGTLKYSILPLHLKEDELIGGNGLMEAGTFLAILIGTMAGGLLAIRVGTETVAIFGMAVAVIGWMASRVIPPSSVQDSTTEVEWNIGRAAWRMFAYARNHKEIAPLLPGIAWFWLVGSVLLTQLPAYVKNTLHGSAEVVTLCLMLFSVGIAAGSMLCNRLLKGKVSAALAPVGAIGIGLFLLALVAASVFSDTCGMGGALQPFAMPKPCDLLGIAAFIASPLRLFLLFCLLMIAVCGGIYVVPLQAMLQARTEEHHRARMVAASNMMSALFTVLGSVAVVAATAAGLGLSQIFAALALLNVPVIFYVRRLK